MSRCPSCFHSLPADRYAWICQSATCETQVDQVAGRFSSVPVMRQHVMHLDAPLDARHWNPPEGVFCEACGTPTQAQVCPDCHWGPLLEGWRSSSTTCVAMAGARQTGKSFYVCLGIKHLEVYCQLQRTTTEFADEQTRVNYQTNYERPLLEQRGLIPPTPPAERDGSSAREPMIWSLGMHNGRRRYLVVRDVAGEDLEGDVSGASHLAFFAHADAVLFMFDPLRVPEIAAQLRDVVPQQSVGGDPQLVLNTVLRLIGSSCVRLGVILSKFDAMEALRTVRGTVWSAIMSNSGASFLRDPGIGDGSYNEVDGALVHEEVRSLLLRLDAKKLVLSLESPSNGNHLPHRFFAVSVLGDPPRRDRLHGRGITPHRCFDPLSWVLSATDAS